MSSQAEIVLRFPIKEFVSFLDCFENVFDGDWEHTKGCLEDRIQSWFIDKDGTFLNPKVNDESNNWANRGALLEKYRILKSALERAKTESENYLRSLN